MKHSGTTKIFVIVWASVLFASYVTGKCIKEVRFKRAEIASQAVTEPEVSSEVQKPSEADKLVSELAKKRPMPGPEGVMRERNIPPEERAGFGEGRRGMRERLENMSEEEREQFRAQMRERFAGRRREGGMGGRFENMSEEERAKMEEERRQMRERMENMSEEEREEFRAQMRERFSGRRSGGRRQEND